MPFQKLSTGAHPACNLCDTERTINGEVVVDFYRISNHMNETITEQFLCLGHVAGARWSGRTVTRLEDPSYRLLRV